MHGGWGGVAAGVALAAVTLACSVDRADSGSLDAPSTARGGTLVVGADQEPGTLNLLGLNASHATAVVVTPVLYGTHLFEPSLQWPPHLLEGEPEATHDPFTLTYRIREEAVWSDGTPISADDLVFTWRTQVDPEFDAASRAGYDRIASADVLDPKTVRFTFSEPFGAAHMLFNAVLPSHLLAGKDVDEATDRRLDVASGPFRFESWNEGADLTLVRNERFWGRRPAIDRIVFRFLPDANTQVQALRGGEVDVIYAQLQPEQAEQIAATPGARYDAKGYGGQESLVFNVATPGLDRPAVRKAILAGIDRQALTDLALASVDPDAQPSTSLLYLDTHPDHEPHITVPHAAQAAVSMLEEDGCARGPDGVFVCDGARLSFRYSVPTGNLLRELQQEVVQAALRDIGIEIVVDNAPADILFGRRAGARDFDILSIVTAMGLDPFVASDLLHCGTPSNIGGYCNRAASDLFEQAWRTFDPVERAALYNEAGRIVAADLPVIPLYSKPFVLAWDERVQGLRNHAAFTWNAQDWSLAGP